MKIKPEVVEKLRAELAPKDTDERRGRYLAGDFVGSAAVRDLNTRYRWDLYWECKFRFKYDNGITDDHIDTALRRIVPNLGEAR